MSIKMIHITLLRDLPGAHWEAREGGEETRGEGEGSYASVPPQSLFFFGRAWLVLAKTRGRKRGDHGKRTCFGRGKTGR